MNMTREEERTKAAKDYADSIAQHEHNKLYSFDDFKAGAKWADEHPLDKTIEDFPELKESEKIRKTLIRFHKSTIDIDAIKGEDILAWLEKQGEQKPKGKSALAVIKEEKVDNANKVEPTDYNSIDLHFGKPIDKAEPKFNIGDWIVDKLGLTQQVLDLRCGIYTCTYNSFTTDCESNYHLWTIQDAKDGDILAGKIDGDNYILIFKQVKDGWVETYGHYYDSVDRFCVSSQLFCRDYQGSFTPATKEQCDLLLTKMGEAGYELDEGSKELKLLITNGGDFFESENCEQNPAWDEEDEHTLQGVIDEIQANKNQAPDYEFETYDRFLFWLKTLKQRIGG
jgi:hypothetical protein